MADWVKMIMNNKPVVLVTAVGVPPGLNALRALLEAGQCDPIAADADPRSPGLYQYGTRHTILPYAADTEAYLQALLKLICQEGVSVILPCLEDEVMVVAQHREALQQAGARLLLPDYQIARTVTDKGAITRIALENGIDCPQSQVIRAGTSVEERKSMLKQFLSLCPLPWIIKPVWGHGMRGVVKVVSLEEAFKAAQESPAELLVQECIPGQVGSMYLAGLLYDLNGRVVRRFSSRSIRTLYPDGGPATAGISVDRPDMVAATEKLVGLIGPWMGPLNAEWMLDPRDDKLKFIEVNPRMWGYGYLATASGLNFPDGIVSLALDRDIGPDPGFSVGVTMLRSTTDLVFPATPFELKV